VRRRRHKRPYRARQVETLLDGLGQKNDTSRDQRPKDRWKGHRNLDMQRNKELFEGLVTLDFEFLMGQNFAASTRVLADLLPQSVLGRAQNGHGWFTDEFGTGLCFPAATFDRVLSVLEAGDPNLKSYLVRRRRTDMLHGFGQYILDNLDKPEITLNIGGLPIFGIDFLADRVVDTRSFVTGLVMAGFMDDWSMREATMYEYKRTLGGYPFRMGGGDILIIDTANFEMCGLGDTGRSVFDDQELSTLTDVGVICRDRDADYTYPEYDQAYFRRCMGDGVCDDMALIWIGAQHGLDAMLGGFVMDAIDTYDKYLLELTWGGYDTHLAGEIQHRFQLKEDEPLVDDRRILQLIHFAAKKNDPPLPLSSSHRRLIQVEPNSSVPTVLNHWRFLQGEPVFEIKLGFSRVPAKEFYMAAYERLRLAGVPVPRPEFVKAKS
jgi:hypothetical protein